MRVTLELSADEARVLQKISEAAGVTVDAVLHGLIGQVSAQERTAAQAAGPPAAPEALDPEALDPEALDPEALDPEALDPEALDPEALADQKRDQEEVEANIKRWHREQKADGN